MKTTPALVFGLAAALAAFALAAFSPGLLNDGDTYWHIRAGEWMLAHHAVLRADIFSYTMAGAPWQTQEWLAETLMALAFAAGGWAGIHLTFALAAAAAAGIVGGFVRARTAFVPALIATVLGLSCVTGSLLARPHTLTLPLLALWTAGLVTAREQNRAPRWWLALVMPLWANLHASFVFGLALAGALMVEAVMESPRRERAGTGWVLFLILSAALTLATPFGVDTILFPLRHTAMPALAHIGEWQATDFSQLSPFAVALLASLFVFGSGRVKVPMFRLLILVGMTAMALMHSRHQMLLGVAAPILLAPALAASWPAGQNFARPLFAALAAMGLLVLAAARLALPVARGDDRMTPATALAHVPRFVRETPVLNDYGYGGWLIWNGVKPFIDSRADLYGQMFLSDYADITRPDNDALAAALTYYHARWTIFPAGAPVVRLLDAMPGWHRYYQDKVAVVHVHD